MTPDEIRRLALGMPQAVESSHMGHPDFQIGKQIFATLGYPDEKSGMVKLKAEQQRMLVSAEPDMFRPANGAWGKQGSTLVKLDKLDEQPPQALSRWLGPMSPSDGS
jgi:hypothetical protein